MKHLLLLLSLLGSLYSFTQPIPFLQFYGERGTTNFPKDFTTTPEGNYRVYSNGNYEFSDNYDQLIYEFNTTTGALDSTIINAERNQNVLSAEEDGAGGAIVALYTTAPARYFRDLALQSRDASGTLTGEFTLSSPFNVSFLESTVDEDINHYTAYAQAVSDYPNNYTIRLLKVDSDLDIVYDIDLEMNGGDVYDILPLPNGEVIVIGQEREGDNPALRKTIRLAEDGTISWTINPDASLVFDGLVYGNDLWLYAPFTQEVTVVDLESGQITNTLDVIGFNSFSISLEILEQGGRFWFVGSSEMAEMELDLNQGVLSATSTYPIETNPILRRARVRDNGQIEILSFTGHLQRVDTNTGEVSTIKQFALPAVNAFLSENTPTAYYDLDNDQYTVSAIHNQGVVSTHLLANDGSFLAAAHLEFDDPSFKEIHPVALAEGQTGLLVVNRNTLNTHESLSFHTYDIQGNLITEEVLELAEDRPINILASSYFDDEAVAFSAFVFDPILGVDRLHTYKIGLDGETQSTITNTPDWVNTSTEQVTIGPDEIGLVGTSILNSDLIVRRLRISFTQDATEELGLGFPGTGYRLYGNNSVSWNTIDGDRSVLGFNIQNNDLAPIYPISIFTGGSVPFSFIPINNYLSANIIYTPDDVIKLVGCSQNPDRTGSEDRYLLRFDSYNLNGSPLQEVSHNMPFSMEISNITSILGSDLMLVSGRYFRDFDTDAFVMVINSEGQITDLNITPPAWAQCTISPNPSSNQLHIDLNNEFTGRLIIRLLNTQGQEIRQWSEIKTINNWQWRTSLAELPAGSYWVQVFSESGQVTRLWQKI